MHKSAMISAMGSNGDLSIIRQTADKRFRLVITIERDTHLTMTVSLS